MDNDDADMLLRASGIPTESETNESERTFWARHHARMASGGLVESPPVDFGSYEVDLDDYDVNERW